MYFFPERNPDMYGKTMCGDDALTATATWTDENQALKDYAYVYKYDCRRNRTRKVLPGCDSTSMRYDKSGRLVFSQDGNQRSKTAKEWTFYLYDAFGRPTVTGVWVSATVPNITNTVVKSTYDATGTKLGGYTVNLTLPATVKLVTVNYYDDYAFTNTLTTAEKAKMAFAAVTGYGNAYPSNTAPNAKGLPTGTRAYQLNDPAKYTVTSMYYDHRGRVVQTHASNHLGGFEDTYSAYTFTGKVKQRQQVHSAPNATPKRRHIFMITAPPPRTPPKGYCPWATN